MRITCAIIIIIIIKSDLKSNNIKLDFIFFFSTVFTIVSIDMQYGGQCIDTTLF